MSSVEKRLDLLGKGEEKPQEFTEGERIELLALTDQLFGPKLSLELCLAVATRMKTVLKNQSRSHLLFKMRTGECSKTIRHPLRFIRETYNQDSGFVIKVPSKALTQ